jgi:phosphatidylinositol 4-phosphatase
MVEGDGLVKEQTSVVRTNCMDCLDRTNVVQSMLARHMITRQLIDCGVFKQSDRVDMFPDFEKMFRNSMLDVVDSDVSLGG